MVNGFWMSAVPYINQRTELKAHDPLCTDSCSGNTEVSTKGDAFRQLPGAISP